MHGIGDGGMNEGIRIALMKFLLTCGNGCHDYQDLLKRMGKLPINLGSRTWLIKEEI